MSFQWPVAKLDLINRALAITGDNLVAVLEDGSDEYNVCSPAYEDGLAVLIEEHNWGFCTKVATLVPSPTAPADTDWDTAYPLPADLIHIVWVKINLNTTDPAATLVNNPTLYDILNGQLVVNAQGGPPPPATPVTPAAVTMKYASSDNADPVVGTPLFVRALSLYVMAGIYRGLHEDAGNADKMFKAAEAIAQRARTRYDQQKPKRDLWRSRISSARRVRRPHWPSGIYDSSGWPD
jgi:hypothetical protein